MSRKGENIYRRKDGRWEARYISGRDENGRARYRAVYAATYQEVRKKKLSAQQKLKEQAAHSQGKSQTVTEVSEMWLEDCAHKWKESTLCRYREKLGVYILPVFGSRDLSDISTEEVERFLVKLQTEGAAGRPPLSASSVGMILTIFKQLRSQVLKADSSVRFSPECIKIKHPKNAITIFSEREEQILISTLLSDTDETDAGILTCLFTGIRIGEICALNCDEIDLENGILHIKRTMQRLPCSGDNRKTFIKIDCPKSDCSIRDIPIEKRLLELLGRFYKPGAFFLTGDAERFIEPRTMENRFQRILKKCGLPHMKFHATRHTFASRCIERGMDVKTLSEILGHASVATTMDRYVHLSMRHKAEGMELISDLFSV